MKGIRKMKTVWKKLNRYRVLWLHFLLFLCLGLFISTGFSVYSGIQRWNNADKSVLANLVVAILAHNKAGDEIPFTPDYTRFNLFVVWDMFNTNSYWVSNNTFKIVPM